LNELPDRSSISYLGIGSNLGDRRKAIEIALTGLAADPGISAIVPSPIYETEAHVKGNAVGLPFLNLVVKIETALLVGDLLKVCQRVERNAGRIRGSKTWEPRTLDIDILLYGDQSIRSNRLTVPHPHIADRRFVLIPLIDLAPDLQLPAPHNMSVRDALIRCNDEHHIERWGVGES
jgi:2-amino-4-hydroxy-6-hydroxymethyldihydropteridine diphosphokinase